MTSKDAEPPRLRRGRDFHALVQGDWEDTAEGVVHRERGITKPSGRRGRIDIFIEADDDLVAVVEVKASDWDRMLSHMVRRNVRRQARQVWTYIESQLAEGKTVCPGIVFPKQPSDPKRRDLIEALFDEEGIPVVWEDESIEDRVRR